MRGTTAGSRGTTRDEIHKAWRATPFQPFTLHLADGRSFFIRRPEYMSLAPTGRTMIVWGDRRGLDTLDVLLVTDIDVHASPEGTGEAA